MAFILSNHSGKNKSIILEDSKTNEKPDVLPRSLTLSQGERSTLTITPKEGWDFRSSNGNVATVSITGTVKGITSGDAIIRCSHKESGTVITVSVVVRSKQEGRL